MSFECFSLYTTQCSPCSRHVTPHPPRLCVPAQQCSKLHSPAPSQCLCCKQSFLPPFILVKSFQIYYVLTKLSVGPWLECHRGFCGCSLPFFTPRLTFLFAFCLKKCTWHLYCSGTTVRSAHRAEPQTHTSLFCHSEADFFLPCSILLV